MKLVYTLSFIVLALTFSCRAKDGAPGPTGATGAPGTTGTTGTSKQQQGTINGTLSYVDVNGRDISFPFDYQYHTFAYNDNSYTTYSNEEGEGYYVYLE